MAKNKNNNVKDVYTSGNLGDNSSKSWWERAIFWLLGGSVLAFLKGLSDKSWIYFLLALLFLGLIIWLLHTCNRDNSSKPYDPVPAQPLPPQWGQYNPPVIPMEPIDIGKIGYGRDTISPIALDRINILLEKQDDDTADEFRSEFKRLYPSQEYAITYFDELTYRLQIRVPIEQHEYIMDNLNAQMPQFEFYMFEETVFYPSYIPSDPGFKQNKDWYFKAIKCYEAWDITRGTDSIKIAVIDNGFDLMHADLKGKYIDPYNVVERSPNLYPPPFQEEPQRGHGTHVAATACGRANNTIGLCGIAPECTLIPIQVADKHGVLALTNILDGILYAIYKGADVINVSLGVQVNPKLQYLPPADQLQLIFGLRKNEERVWDEVFKIAHNRNTTLVFAAGNENVLSGFDAMKRNNSTIIVSAVDQNFQKADFSNYGNYEDIPFCFSTVSAPGIDIVNAYPGNTTISMNGTSMASPIVAGAVALMKSINKDLTTEQIIEILQNTGIQAQAPIGNIIQLDAALKAVQSGNYGKKKNADNRLTNPSERLRSSDFMNDISNLYGMWKSTKQLQSSDNHDLDLYMYFSEHHNQILIIETSNNNKRYTGDLDIKLQNDSLMITQTKDAYATDGEHYKSNKFVCTTDKQGYLVCDAFDMDGTPRLLQFNLVKVQ